MKLRSTAALMACALWLPGLGAAVPQANSPARQLVPVLDAVTIDSRCPRELAAMRARVAAMEASSAPDVLREWNSLSIASADFLYPVYLLANVATDKATRDAAQACVEAFSPLEIEIFQSQTLLARVQALKPTDAIDASYRRDLLEAFEDSGATLPAAQRERVKAIREELDKIGLAFQKRVNEDGTTVAMSAADLKGLPASWLKDRQRDAQGHVRVGLDYPSYIPFMQNAVSEDARHRLWLAAQNQGGAENIERLDRAVALRREMAAIYGVPDFASFTLKRRMAGTPANVQEFLARVRGAVDAGEKREIAELRADKAKMLGKPVEQVKLERWDVAFHQERIQRERYQIDQEGLRAYFPTEASVAYALRVAQQLYGIEFVPAKVATWHDDVRYYDVFDLKDGQRGDFLGGVYLDLFPRDGKYNHAAAFGVAPASRLSAQRPTSALVTNFNRQGLNHEELETLMHEFGHVLHGVLSQTRYADQAGTSVKRDFVEAPSQMFEEWARRPEPLALFAELAPAAPRLTPELIERLDAARKYGRGLRYGAQWLYAEYDMRLHTAGNLKGALATWADLQKTTPLGYVEGTMFPASFGHVMGGYAAGYYGYMWSEVMALDMLAAYQGRLLDGEVGRKYRSLILERGGETPPAEMVESFLGRQPGPAAFEAEIAGRR
ncbi:MAG: M3 family metallopeptidase [Burkholderiaceae bacterium]